jgi:hypothetical protein
MPGARSGRAFAALALAAALGACAATGTRPGAGVAQEEGGGEARAAVIAFAQICSRLDRPAVLREAGRFGFAPVRREALPPEAAAAVASGTTFILVRPGPNSPMLFWDDTPQCQLIASGLAPADVEAEFGRFLTTLGDSPQLSVAMASPEQLAALPADGPARPRQAAVVMPRALVGDAQRSFVLSVAPQGPVGPVVAMSTRRIGGAGGVSPARQPEAKAPLQRL